MFEQRVNGTSRDRVNRASSACVACPDGSPLVIIKYNNSGMYFPFNHPSWCIQCRSTYLYVGNCGMDVAIVNVTFATALKKGPIFYVTK